MTGKKRGTFGRIEEAYTGLGDEALGAAYIGDQVLRAEDGRQSLHKIERGIDGNGEQNYLACAGSFEGVGCYRIDCVHLLGELGMIWAAIPTHDFAAKSGCTQSEAYGSAEQAGAEDGDARDHGRPCRQSWQGWFCIPWSQNRDQGRPQLIQQQVVKDLALK